MKLVKYPSTFHLPWAPGLQNDDRRIDSLDEFVGREVIVSEKFDGENATCYRDHYHARSLDSRHHPSRDWMKRFHGQIKYEIPTNVRICGENLYARHSIFYADLPSYFLGFSAWIDDDGDEGGRCFSWDDTLLLFSMLGIEPVRELWRGSWEEFYAHHEMIDAIVQDNVEGYVVRVTDGFMFSEFGQKVAKFVRKNHIQTDSHWMSGPVIPNGLRHVE